MARRTPKYPAGPPIIDSNQFGCMPGFSGIFDFHHGRPCQKLLLNDTHGIRSLTGEEQTRNQAKTLTSFDESCRRINKKNKAKKEAGIMDQNRSPAMSFDLAAHDEGFCNHIPLKKGKRSSSSRTKHYQIDENNLQMVNTVEKSLWKRIMKSRYGHPNKGKEDLHQSKSFGSLKPNQKTTQNLHYERAGSSSGATYRENKKSEPVDLKSIVRSSLLTVAYSKKQEPDIFAEARKHLSERLRKVEKAEELSSKKGPRTLERILLLSPKHEMRAILSPKSVSEQMRFSPYGNSPLAYEKSLQTKKEKIMNDHNQLEDPFMTDNPSSSGYVKILETPLERSIPDTEKIIKENVRQLCPSELHSENELSKSSPDRSPSSTVNIYKLQITNMDKEREENPSPVSILDPFFMDDVSSPSSSFTELAETPMHPRRLDFDEHPEINLSANMKDRELISRYIMKVYRNSVLNWDEFLAKGWPLECCDQKLLRDCIKEVLIDLHRQYYEYPPFISFLKPEIQAVRMEEKLVKEVMKEVDWYTIPRAMPTTLDQLARKDIAKNGKWIDIRVDAEDIVIEIVEDALEDSILELIDDLYLQI